MGVKKSAKKTKRNVEKHRATKKENADKENADENIKGIVRICNQDINGYYPLYKALWQIKGVGLNLASILSEIASNRLGIKEDVPIGSLEDEQIDQLEDIIYHPANYNVPEYLLNRRRDPVTGETKHLIGNDIVMAVRSDKQRLMAMKSWRGMRHQTKKGKVRGQRTRSTGRGKVAVGVIRWVVAKRLDKNPKRRKNKGGVNG